MGAIIIERTGKRYTELFDRSTWIGVGGLAATLGWTVVTLGVV